MQIEAKPMTRLVSYSWMPLLGAAIVFSATAPRAQDGPGEPPAMVTLPPTAPAPVTETVAPSPPPMAVEVPVPTPEPASAEALITATPLAQSTMQAEGPLILTVPEFSDDPSSADETQAESEQTQDPVPVLTMTAPVALNVNEARFIRLDHPAKSVFLSNPGVADIDLQSARYLYIVGRSIGETSLFVLGKNDEEIMRSSVNVRIDAARLTAAARRAAGSGSVNVSAVDGAVFLTGAVASPEDAEAARAVVAGLAGSGVIVVNRLETGNRAQINLQVRIAEVSRSISEDLGIRLSASRYNGRNTFNSADTGINGPFTVSVANGSRNINLVLDALARNGLVTILSEPNLTTRSGETANFLAGGRVPYVYGSGDDTSLQMEAIGVELEFTPTVKSSNRIEIMLNTRVRDIDRMNSSTAEAPALTERSATTTVELGNGQSFAIAGMFQASSQQGFNGLPGLSRLPVIGALFRSSRFARGESELVIIVTPYLVKPQNSRPRDPVSDIPLVQSGIEQAITGRFTRTRRPGAPLSATGSAGGFMLQ